jgi:membrane protease YdiL (CAAX protease family)
MKLPLELALVFTAAILPHILAAFYILLDPKYLGSLPPWQRMLTGGVHDTGKILLIAYIAASHADGFTAFGLVIPPDKLVDTLLYGLLTAGYLSLVFVAGRLRSKADQARREALLRTVFEAGGFSHFRSPRERAAYLIVLWTGVVAEDLVFRGYLVLGLGALTGVYWPWVIASVLLSTVLHLYQGLNRQIMLAQALFAGIFIALTLWTGNVYAAILAHLAYDTIWVVRGWAKYSGPEPQPPEPLG